MASRLPLLTVELRFEHDVVLARQRGRHIASLLSFDGQDQTRIATAVSEIARNAFRYAGGGRVELSVEDVGPIQLVVRVTDQGKGIQEIDAVLGGRYQSKTGMGLGILGTKRLMDRVEIETSEAGTRILFAKTLPASVAWPDSNMLQRLAAALAAQPPDSSFAEVQQQNQELLRAMAALKERDTELAARELELRRLNEELVDTNRGVFALYVELEEKMLEVSRAASEKLRFLSHVSHEIRTPINAIMGLSELVLDGSALHADDRRALGLMRRSAEDLSTLVDDLLDSAKLEAGRAEVRVEAFSLGELFSAVRGTFLAIHKREEVLLRFDEELDALTLETDRGKLAQILRNLVSNALKFTEAGEVTVSAERRDDSVRVRVRDTGIGIAPEDQARVFDEFTQLESSVQRRVRGTGLGLSIARRLAVLLGGDLGLESVHGVGSTFTLTLPLQYLGAARVVETPEALPVAPLVVGRALTVLIIDDEEASRLACKAELAWLSDLELLEAADGESGVRIAREALPDAIVLDYNLPDRSGAQVLLELAGDERTRAIPVVVRTGRHVTAEDRAGALRHAIGVLSKSVSGRAASAVFRELFSKAGLVSTSAGSK